MSNDGEAETRRQPRRADFELGMDELRTVTVFTSAAAEAVLPHFEKECPDDGRPRQALEAALAFAHGAPRSRAQRVTAPAAHRAGREAPSDLTFHAAMATGDAAASAYLHPLADSAQSKHILRGPAHAIRVFELIARPDEDEDAGSPLERFATLATPQLAAVLRRYPRTDSPPNKSKSGTNRINRLMHELDVRLRGQPTAASSQPTTMGGQP